MATIIAGGAVWRIKVEQQADGRWRAAVAKGLGRFVPLAVAYDGEVEAEEAAAAAVLRLAREAKRATA